ncbi:MAG TPA: ATP-dependent 6-phosphofructokinase [Blastocatellia bacterium]|nr:ATP-dependent 6-phosphofructokinase [Blastocatellia bacterium]
MDDYLGIMTGGGDCPGLNALIRAVVRRAVAENKSVLGIHSGWQGLIDGDIEPLTRYSVAGIQYRGGTILGTSRSNPLSSEESLQKIRHNWRKFGLSSLIVAGGNGTLSCSMRMWRDEGYPIVGIPKTIDNDIEGTDYTFGFDTAVSIATEAIDRLHTTAEAHHRVMVVEVMGRHSGWIATHAGIAGAADIILIPEKPFRISEVCEMLSKRKEMGRPFSIVVVAEDARPHKDEDFLTDQQKERIYREEHLGGIGHFVGLQIEKRTGLPARVAVLGYIQRGGSPTAYDRVLAARMGVYAVEMVIRGEFGKMAALHGTKIVSVPLEEVADKRKPVSPDIYHTAEVFFG